MSSQQMDLFRMNAHGDSWEEPDLFAQGGPVPPAPAGISPEMAAARADHLAYLAELEAEQRRPLEELRRRLPEPRRVSPCLFELELEELRRARTLAARRELGLEQPARPGMLGDLAELEELERTWGRTVTSAELEEELAELEAELPDQYLECMHHNTANMRRCCELCGPVGPGEYR